MMMKLSLGLAALLPFLVSAADIAVDVGKSGLSFDPTSVNATTGDVIVFSFFPQNHTVTESSFAAPCTSLEGGEDSEFTPVSSASTPTTWNLTIDDDSTRWFYCAQKSPANHCAAGMVFAINPTANRTFAAFQAAAKAGTTPSSTGSTAGTSTSGGASGGSTGTPNSGAFQLAYTSVGSLLAIAGLTAGLAL